MDIQDILFYRLAGWENGLWDCESKSRWEEGEKGENVHFLSVYLFEQAAELVAELKEGGCVHRTSL